MLKKIISLVLALSILSLTACSSTSQKEPVELNIERGEIGVPTFMPYYDTFGDDMRNLSKMSYEEISNRYNISYNYQNDYSENLTKSGSYNIMLPASLLLLEESEENLGYTVMGLFFDTVGDKKAEDKVEVGKLLNLPLYHIEHLKNMMRKNLMNLQMFLKKPWKS